MTEHGLQEEPVETGTTINTASYSTGDTKVGDQYVITTFNREWPNLAFDDPAWHKKPDVPVIGGKSKSAKDRRKAKLAKQARRRNRR